jgi:hypothetical protein
MTREWINKGGKSLIDWLTFACAVEQMVSNHYRTREDTHDHIVKKFICLQKLYIPSEKEKQDLIW